MILELELPGSLAMIKYCEHMSSITLHRSISVLLAGCVLCSQLLASITGQCGCPVTQATTSCCADVAGRSVENKDDHCCSTSNAADHCSCSMSCGESRLDCVCRCGHGDREQAPKDGEDTFRIDGKQTPVGLAFLTSVPQRSFSACAGLVDSSCTGNSARILFCVWRI